MTSPDPHRHLVDRLHDLVGYCDDVERLIVQGGYDAFIASETSRYAAEALLMRIGATVRDHVDAATRARYPDQPWGDIWAMRVLIVHPYQRIDPDMVWFTCVESIAALRAYVADIMIPGECGPGPASRSG